MPDVQASAAGMPVALARPSAKNARAALVEVRGGAQPRHRAPASAPAASSASPGEVHGVAQAAADELVDEGAQAEIGVGSGHDAACDAPAARPPARLHADPPELAADGPGAGGTLSRARPGPPRPRPGGAPDAELRRLRGLRPRARADAPFTLAGYSMGGRIALHTALTLGPRSSRGSCSSARARGSPTRRSAQRAARPTTRSRTRIETLDIEAFAREWGAQPLFAGQPRARRGAAPTPTGCATRPPGSRPRCAASGPA